MGLCACRTPTHTVRIVGHWVSKIIDTVIKLGEPLATPVTGIVFAVPGIRTVIGKKDYDSIVVFTDILEKFYDSPIMVIHIVYHAGIDFHSP